ncbi:MAG: enoyl-CoA hydratase/isomerase family protein [Candidatus Binatia bacterium]|nr:enoyl-CoA hydratase/isomerase family protein [Candidatus Binatia bacterium]
MTYHNLLFTKKDGIGYITLNRPEKLNALSAELMAEFRHLLDAIEEDPEVRVVILTGAGRAFSAGFDIGAREGEPEIYERSADEWRTQLKQHIETFLKIWHSGKPYIAAINGYALAGACELAQLCDIKIASEQAVLGEPEIRFGTGPPVLITPFSVGLAKAKELLLTGEMISAQEAERLGMINKVVPHERLMAECEKVARKLMKIAQVGIKFNKAAINRAYENMGFLNSIYHNLELVVHFDTTRTAEQETFNRIRKEKGLRAALDWRDALFKEEDE